MASWEERQEVIKFRSEIEDTIKDSPGVNVFYISYILGGFPSTVKGHIEVLNGVGLVHQEGDGYFPGKGDLISEPKKPGVEDTRNLIVETIKSLQANGPVTTALVAAKTNMTLAGVESHLKALDAEGRVIKQRAGKTSVYIA